MDLPAENKWVEVGDRVANCTIGCRDKALAAHIAAPRITTQIIDVLRLAHAALDRSGWRNLLKSMLALDALLEDEDMGNAIGFPVAEVHPRID
jgi:hypothetical protein